LLQEHSLAAIYTVMINAVSASFDTERNQHLISRVCLANLHNCLDVSLDMLTKGIKVTDHPLIEFMEEVKRWIHNGQQGIAMSHHLFDHLLMSTDMLFGVITTFRFLVQVAININLPGWYTIPPPPPCSAPARLSLSVYLSVCVSVRALCRDSVPFMCSSLRPAVPPHELSPLSPALPGPASLLLFCLQRSSIIGTS
jgi:hypothetical protein